jgi:hypothetical protein
LAAVEEEAGRVRLHPVQEGQAADAGRRPVGAQDAARVAALWICVGWVGLS